MPRRFIEHHRRRPVPADAAHRPHTSTAGAHGLARAADHRRPAVSDRRRRRAATTSPRRCGCWRRASSSTIRSADVCVALSAGAVSTHDWCDGWQALAVPRQIDAGPGSRRDPARPGWSGGRSRIRVRRRRIRPAGQRKTAKALRRAAGLPGQIPVTAHTGWRFTPGRGDVSRRHCGPHRRRRRRADEARHRTARS